MEQIPDQRLDDDRPEFDEQRCTDILSDLLAGHRWEDLWKYIDEHQPDWLNEVMKREEMKLVTLTILRRYTPGWLVDLAEELTRKEMGE